MIAKPMAITIPSKTPSVISRPKSIPPTRKHTLMAVCRPGHDIPHREPSPPALSPTLLLPPLIKLGLALKLHRKRSDRRTKTREEPRSR
jgi:hypothetical protein